MIGPLSLLQLNESGFAALLGPPRVARVHTKIRVCIVNPHFAFIVARSVERVTSTFWNLRSVHESAPVMKSRVLGIYKLHSTGRY